MYGFFFISFRSFVKCYLDGTRGRHVPGTVLLLRGMARHSVEIRITEADRRAPARVCGMVTERQGRDRLVCIEGRVVGLVP
jgi:hypothetical protein